MHIITLCSKHIVHTVIESVSYPSVDVTGKSHSMVFISCWDPTHTHTRTSLRLFTALCRQKCNLFIKKKKKQATVTATGLELTCKLVSVQDLAKCDDIK